MRFFTTDDLMDMSPITPFGPANVTTDGGQWLVATTEHPASSHGLPVVVDADGIAYGPAEIGPLRDGGCNYKLLRRAGYQISSVQENH